MADDGVRLLARGATVVLADGIPRQLILDMEALEVIEERMGSLSAYSEGLALRLRSKLITAVRTGLIAGFSHLEDEIRPSPKAVAALMRWDDITKYVAALDEAWVQGIPSARNGTQSKASGAARSSRGRTSSDASQSTTAEAAASSGA